MASTFLDASERLRVLEETVAAGVFTVDRATHAVAWDQAMCDLHGVPSPGPDTVSAWGALLADEDAVMLRGHLLNNAESFQLQLRLTDAAGDLRYFLCTARERTPGEPHLVVGSCLDITPRAAALERFAEAERLGGVGSWSFDLRSGAIEWSDQVYHFFGRDPEEGPPDFDSTMADYDDDSEPLLRDAVQRAVAEGRAYGLHLRTRHGHNGVRYLYARGDVKRDRTGALIGLHGTVTDVTAQTELELSIRNIAACVPGALYEYVLRPDGHSIPYISDGVYQLYRLTPEEAQEDPNSIFGCIDPDHLPRIAASIEASAKTLSAWQADFPVTRKDGVRRHLWSSSIPRPLPEGGIVWHGYTVDITDRVAAEAELERARVAAEQASVAKSDFLASMSHEIRTPITAILGYLELIQQGWEVHDPELDLGASLRTVRANAQHLLQVLNDILDVSKIEAGRMTVEEVPVAPWEVLDQVAALHRRVADDLGLEFVVTCDGSVPGWVRSDPTRLRQVIHNIVGNALKFTQEGQVALRASYEESTEMLGVTVTDTGVGMSPEQLERVRRFDPFNQADGSTTRRYGGTGLGLCISNQLSGLLGGTLQVESTDGVGSTFTLTVHAPEVAAPKRQARQATTDDALDGCRILLAEDGPDNQRLIGYILRRAGAEVTVAANGRIAVEQVRENGPFDLVLMDMAMPELDGYGATRALRSSGMRTPVIALTAHAMAEDRRRCLDAGCDDYLTKPFQRQELIQVCVRWLAPVMTEA